MSLNVIALGGNAILDTDPTDEGQKAVVNHAAKYIAEFVAKGEQVIVCHGNGPQVGNLLLQQKQAKVKKSSVEIGYLCCDDTRKHRLLVTKCFN